MEIGHQRLGVLPISHRGIGIGRICPPRGMAAGAGAGVYLLLGDHGDDRWDVHHLPSAHKLSRDAGQVAAAAVAILRHTPVNDTGLGHHPQVVPLVTRLTARPAARHSAQAARPLAGGHLRGGRSGTVAAVLRYQLLSEGTVLLLQRDQSGLQFPYALKE